MAQKMKAEFYLFNLFITNIVNEKRNHKIKGGTC